MPLLQQIYCKEGDTCTLIPLEKRKVVKKTLSKSLGFFFIFILGPVVLAVLFLRVELEFPSGPNTVATLYLALWIIILAFVAVVLGRLVYEIFYFRFYFYDFSDAHFVIRKGVISRTEITIQYNRIQNIFIDQDFFDRIFGLYDVHVATADIQSGPEAHIDGVNAANAKKLQELLRSKVQQ